jgi:hypothetical protein
MAVNFASSRITINGNYNNNNYVMTLEPSRPTQGRFLLNVNGDGVNQENIREVAIGIITQAIQEADID